MKTSVLHPQMHGANYALFIAFYRNAIYILASPNIEHPWFLVSTGILELIPSEYQGAVIKFWRVKLCADFQLHGGWNP